MVVFLRLKDLIFPKINLKELPIIDILSLFILHSKYYSHGIKNNRKGSCVVFKLDIVKIGGTNTIDTLHFLFFLALNHMLAASVITHVIFNE